MIAKFSEIADIIMGQSPKGEDVNDCGIGLPLLNGPTEFTEWHPLPVQYTTRGIKLAKKLDILFCVRGSTTGRMNIADQKYVIGRGLAAIRGKNGYPTLYVKLVIEKYLPDILVSATGSTFPNVSRDLLSNLDVDVLDVREAQKISHIFSVLQQKINNNSYINKTLESIAQSLFKSWFVDFEPVKAKITAKEKGEDPQLAAMIAISGKTAEEINQLIADKRKELADTTDLFPDEMIESELGDIPRGWKVGKIGELYYSKGGYAFKSNEFINKGFPVVKIKNITSSGYVDLTDTQKISLGSAMNKDSFILKNGDVIMAMTGATIGKVGIIANYMNCNCFLNQRVAKFTPVNRCDRLNWFIYTFFKKEENVSAILSMSQGSAQPNISTSGIDNITTIIPNNKLINRFNIMMDPLFKTWINNNIQSNMLSEMQKILQSELLSGKVSINELL